MFVLHFRIAALYTLLLDKLHLPTFESDLQIVIGNQAKKGQHSLDTWRISPSNGWRYVCYFP